MEEILNHGQQEALKIALERYRNKEKYTYIAGAAGTGKSFLVQHIIAALDLDPVLDVCYASYTGKAALNLQRKNCPNACTLHSLIYNARQNKQTGVYYFSPKPVGSIKFKLIVVDEISMVTQDMWDLLLTHNIPIIALGDIAQLPAIGETNKIADKPHKVLTEIMRQDEDSEIIQIATLLREHKEIPFMKGTNVQVLHRRDYDESILDWADVTLCATNNMRNRLNKVARQRLWGDANPAPRKEDKIVCLHNEWNCCTKGGDILVNGLVGYISCKPIVKEYPPALLKYGATNYTNLDFVPDFRERTKENTFFNLNVDTKIFTQGVPTVNQKNFRYFGKLYNPYQFDYAYALSVWKAQGSEYGKVLLFEESFPYGDTHWQYLYTGATRAIDRLVIIRNI